MVAKEIEKTQEIYITETNCSVL